MTKRTLTDNELADAQRRVQRRAIAQAQDSVTDQLKRLVQIANREGLYDAADWVTARLAKE